MLGHGTTQAEYHLFEPKQEFAENLRQKVGDKPNVHINQVGVGDVEEGVKYSIGVQAFVGGEAPIIDGERLIQVINLDRYVIEHKIELIDFLKIDVEGYDFKVLLGAPLAVSRSKFIQYEHWNSKKQYYALLGEQFDMEYVGYRNVLCMNKTLVDVRTRNRIREFIEDNNYRELA